MSVFFSLMNNKDHRRIDQKSYIRMSHSQMVHKIGVLKYFEKFTRKRLCRSLVCNKVAGWGHNINIKSLKHFLFLCAWLSTKSKFPTPITQCNLTHNWKVRYCLHSSDIISHFRSCGDCLRKNLKIKRDKDLWIFG